MQIQWELIERAKEELEIIETEHPNRFELLKTELKDFISDLELQINSNITTHYADTQESSSMEKRKKVGSCLNKMSKTEVVLEKALHCLCKIQHFKASLCSSNLYC
ncbi:Unknown protein [Striga hermonthica]|uniref:Uncharacterized protein n=1 Tax=Striga hermonthica TaxID=68872 RepID=A0A9N7MUG3_STRHE|nr:Unknown protein [Striga hermonthica]